jgi:hypothetical protein
VNQSISYNPFGLLRKNIPYYLKGPDASGGGVSEASLSAKPRRASLSGQGGHIKGFICTLYDSCTTKTLIQILQNEINESKSAQREKKRTPKQRYDF